jgi:hypothetical protein
MHSRNSFVLSIGLVAFFAILLCGFQYPALAADHSRDLVRIYTPDRASLTKIITSGLDVASSRPGYYVEVLAGEKDNAILQSLGLRFEMITQDIGRVKAERNRAALPTHPSFGYGSMGGFYTYDEAIAVIDSLHNNDPYGIISDLDTLNYTHLGRPIVYFKISDNVETNEDEPEVFYNAVHHAREPMGVMTLVYYIEHLLGQYTLDPEITYLVDNREMYFIPFVNPDGFAVNESIYFNYSEFGYWRKNARDNNSNGIIDNYDGVDLNRNYGYMWGYDDIGSSPEPGDPTYRGPAEFSEPETGTVRTFCWDHQFQLALNYHSSGQLMIQPWGYNDEETPDSLYYRELGENITEINNYQYGTGMQTINYVTNGDADDWLYGEQGEKPRIYAMTPEVGHSYDGFYAELDRILPLAQENLYANLYVAQVAGGYLMVNGEAMIEDSLGDGNGNMDPGETVDIAVPVWNPGLTQSLSIISATLSCSSPMIDIDKSVSDFGTLSSLENGDNSTDPFQVTLHDTIPNGDLVWFHLDFTADGGYVSQDSFEIIVGTPETVFFDDAEDGTGNFDVTFWGTDAAYSHSGDSSFSDSPGREYVRNYRSFLTLADPLDLSEAGHAYLTYYARWRIERDWDIAKIQLSRNGTSWETLDGTNSHPGSGFESYHSPDEEGYHSNQSFFKKETIDLTDYTGPGNETVYFQFLLFSDGGVEFDGIYIDDIEVLFYPELETGFGDDNGETPSIPRALTLSQNYPNPFNPMTTIDVEIPGDSGGKALLRIYDVRGKLVRTLADRELKAGSYSFAWDGRDDRGRPVSSGVYIYTLKQADTIYTRKMTILR